MRQEDRASDMHQERRKLQEQDRRQIVSESGEVRKSERDETRDEQFANRLSPAGGSIKQS